LVLSLLGSLNGSVRAHATKYNLFFRIGIGGRLCGFPDGQDGDRAAEELQSAAVGRNRLVLAAAIILNALRVSFRYQFMQEIPVQRRELLGGVALSVASLVRPTAVAGAVEQPTVSGGPFNASSVRDLARQLAQQPYKPPENTLPDALTSMDYETYRAIRFDPGHALWRGENCKFTAEFFHRGFIYKNRVDIYEVADGKVTPIRYSPDLFTFSKGTLSAGDWGFAGFRIHYPLNRPDYYDEVCAFLGASYFRAVAKGQAYGLSARGLAIKTAEQGGEEFPIFKAFWLERPVPGTDLIVVHALLDSASCAAAFRFTIRPGEDTIFDTESALYPRVDIAASGLAPLTSMFLFDVNDRPRVDDWRAAVHDSAGLKLRTGADERIWRPLTNPKTLQVSAFVDTSPRGFGLMQRPLDFPGYQDLEAHYEKRPSAWVEPIGDWGPGIVQLVEIPSDREINDNIVSFWRPKDPLRAKGEYLLNYRLHWCRREPNGMDLGQVAQTRCGLSWHQKNRQFVIDFTGAALAPFAPDKLPTLDAGCDRGKVVNATVEENPAVKGWRVSLEVDTADNLVVELHARLMNGDQPLTEKWMYRWTPS
jgi:glucans biosynthesis protein